MQGAPASLTAHLGDGMLENEGACRQESRRRASGTVVNTCVVPAGCRTLPHPSVRVALRLGVGPVSCGKARGSHVRKRLGSTAMSGARAPWTGKVSHQEAQCAVWQSARAERRPRPPRQSTAAHHAMARIMAGGGRTDLQQQPRRLQVPAGMRANGPDKRWHWWC